MNSRSSGVMAQRRLLTIMTAAIVAVGAGGIALGATAITTAGNTINGCYNPNTGALTIITPNHTRCTSTQNPISWNKTGPQGPPGPATTSYFTGGEQAGSLGTATIVASLRLPAGSFVYNSSVNFVNSTTSSDNVTCTLTDAGGTVIDTAQSTVPASFNLAIPLAGASNAPAGTVTVSCQDIANSASAYVDGASLAATSTAKLPTATAILRIGSVTGRPAAVNDTLGLAYAPPECTSGSETAKVTANPKGPGTATVSITSISLSGCSVGGISASITAVGLPWTVNIGDVNGNLSSTTGTVGFKVTAVLIACTFSATSLKGYWSNSVNGIVVPSQNFSLTSGGGSCPSTFAVHGNLAPVKDTSVSGSPLVFVS